MAERIARQLGIAETAILGSTIPWCIDRYNGEPTRLHSIASFDPDDLARGYLITGQGDTTRYWTAYAPGGCHPANELAAGAGDMGLAKCIKACERHLSRQR